MRAARQVNDHKPRVVLDKIRKAASGFASPVIACLGLTFKADIDDLRESPALAIVSELAAAGVGRLLVVEPNVDALPPAIANRHDVALTDMGEAIAKADVVVFLVNHKSFSTIESEHLNGKLVVNACGWRQ